MLQEKYQLTDLKNNRVFLFNSVEDCHKFANKKEIVKYKIDTVYCNFKKATMAHKLIDALSDIFGQQIETVTEDGSDINGNIKFHITLIKQDFFTDREACLTFDEEGHFVEYETITCQSTPSRY